MGDGGQVAVRSEGDAWVHIYTRWSGYSLADDVARAIGKGWRWNDSPYLTRIIAEEVISERGEETGYGIAAGPRDLDFGPEYPVIYVDPDAQTVTIGIHQWSFRDYPTSDHGGYHEGDSE